MPKKPGADDWVDTLADQDDPGQSTTSEIVVLRELPAKPTERQASHAASHHKQLPEEPAQDFRALAPAFTGAPAQGTGTAFAEARAEALFTSLNAARSTWQSIEAEIEDACFNSIMELGVNAHLNTIKRLKQGEALLIPTVILSSSGLAAGNQKATYSRLMDHLKKKQGVGGAISAAIGQLSDGASADDMHALYQWYQDETGSGAATEPQPRTPGPAQTATPTQPPPATQGKPSTQAKRTTRQRKQLTPLPGQIKIMDQFVVKQKGNSQRQLVLVLTHADQVPTPALQDLTAALQQDYARFPVTLVLCINRPASLFLSTLPMGCCSRLAPTVKDLPTQTARLEALIQGLLLAKPPGITLLSERPLLAVLQHYEHQAGSADGVMQALEVAHALHYAEQPLAILAHAALNEHSTSQKPPAEVIELTDSDDDASTPENLPKLGAKGRGKAAATEAATPGLLRQLGGLGVDSTKKKARTSPTGLATTAARRGGVLSATTTLEDAVGELPDSLVVDVSRRWAKTGGEPGPLSTAPVVDDESTEGYASAEITITGVTAGVEAEGAGRTKRAVRPPKHADGEAVVPVTKPKQRRATSVEPDAPQPSAAPAASAKQAPVAKPAAAPRLSQAALADARAQVVCHVRGAVDTLARWWLGVVICHESAQATGAWVQRAEYRLPSLCCALASPALNHVTRKGRVSACQHLLSELFGQGPLSVRSLTEDARIYDLLDTIEQAVHDLCEWRPLLDIIALIKDIARLKQDPPVAATATHEQDAPVGAHAADKTPTTGRHMSRTAGLGPSPTSLLRRDLEAARIESPPGPSKQRSPPVKEVGKKTEPGAGAEVAAGKPAGGSKARRAQLQQLVTAEAEKAQPSRSVAAARGGPSAGGGEQPVLTRADHVANWLRDLVQRLVEQCPFTLPGAAVFTFDNARVLEDSVLMPQPRASVNDALLHPSRYLGANCIDDATPLSTDIEVAYQRLVGRESVSISAWFEEFCDVQNMAQHDYLGSAAPSEARGDDKPAAKTATGKGKAAGSKGSDPAPVSKGKRKAEDEAEEADMEEKVLNWAARFSQAVNELQYMGIVRPNKRRGDGRGMQVMFKPQDMNSAF